MSSEAPDAQSSAQSTPDGFDGDYVEFLHELVVDLRVEVDELKEETETLRDENDRLEERIESNEAEIAALDERTDIMAMVEQSDDPSAKQRRSMLLLHMKQMAEQRAKSGKKRAYTVTQEKANEALHAPDIHRTTFYSDFRAIERWVGNKDVCEYIPDSGGESRLKIDLTQGELVGESMPADLGNKLSGGA